MFQEWEIKQKGDIFLPVNILHEQTTSKVNPMYFSKYSKKEYLCFAVEESTDTEEGFWLSLKIEKGAEQQGLLKKSILSHQNQISKHTRKYRDKGIHSEFASQFSIDPKISI